MLVLVTLILVAYHIDVHPV